MPQSLVVANGNMLVNFDANLQMRDFFYPFIGQENHSSYGKIHRLGLWVDGAFSWLNDGHWEITPQYHNGALVGHSVAENKGLGVKLIFEDFVYTTHDILFRKITVHNHYNHEREFRLYFSHDFYLYGDKMEDTAIYEPDLNAMLHYRKQRYFLLNGAWDHCNSGISEFTTGKSNYGDREGTWRDAEDGHLHGNPIEQGSVDSTIGFYKSIAPDKPRTLYFWIAAGKNYGDINRLNKRVTNLGPEKIFQHTYGYWKQWATKHEFKLKGVPKEAQKLWYQSLLLIRSQIDNRGAIIASTDSDIMKFNKDTYAYVWPRDAALVSVSLARAGYFEPVKSFLKFAKNLITPDGYVLHKFTPDGSLGSSWHPKLRNGKSQIPIQEDESALLLVALWELYKESKSIEVAQRLFNPMVLKIGRFLIQYVNAETGLPKESYDLWEEQYGVFTFTCATVYAGLKAAENLSHITGHYEDEIIFRDAAKKMQQSILKYMYSEEHGRFVKKIYYEEGELKVDPTVDSSVAFVWEMGLLPADDPRMISTMQAIEDHLKVQTEVGGICRYEGDFYHRNWEYEYSAKLPGNPWIITTLWLANWKLEMATTIHELHPIRETFDWVCRQQNSAGILPEQMDPHTGDPLSVAPLTWSHSTYVDSVLRYTKKYQALKELKPKTTKKKL
ncbi:glycoside hydrolase family 15 protein [Candidatus Peregrinibacteria bacterium]|nr:glycoside hydrolase family 15 protein [bacterium]NCQ55842.1 glycoside hydrolase family 15 protein [Candidatus Parcubacteria bacterium]NCS67909.1 glycoside hydrolase family 15 protein [Candidatus Peregrinibacteria bacterium]